MSIQQWPVSERPREKLMSHGAQSLSDAELLAIFLRTGTPGSSAVDLARDLISEYGGLRPLFQADRARFCRTRGLANAKFAQLQAVLELARRHLGESLSRDGVLQNPEETRCYLKAKLREYPYEVFACLFLDARHRVIACEELFRGTLDGASVHPREVLRRALQHNAAALILAHNHPSGVAEPSQADRRITERLREVMSLVDIRVLDHVVIGDRNAVSFAERGWI